MPRLYAGGLTALEEEPQAFVPKRLDPVPIVACCASRNNRIIRGFLREMKVVVMGGLYAG
jgi:hypothetical protein